MAPVVLPPREEGRVAEEAEPPPARSRAAQEVQGLRQAGEDVDEDVVWWERAGAGVACRGHRIGHPCFLLGLDVYGQVQYKSYRIGNLNAINFF